MKTALASFPRSGNTWLRYMIEVATGKQSGSVYRGDRVLNRPGQGIVIKTHMRNWWNYDRAIHLVRAPWDAINSFWYWYQDLFERPRDDWSRFVRNQAHEWADHSEAWLKAEIPLIGIRYEDMHADPGSVLRSVLDWLEEEGDVQEAVAAAKIEKMRKLGGKAPKFFRKGQIGEGWACMSPAEREFVRARCRPFLEEFGY